MGFIKRLRGTGSNHAPKDPNKLRSRRQKRAAKRAFRMAAYGLPTRQSRSEV